MIKPSIPSKIAKLEDVADDSAKSLFGDNISESLDSLTRENETKYLLKYKANEGFEQINYKRKHQDSSNFKNSSKTQKSTDTNLGQIFKSSSFPRGQYNYKLQPNKHNQGKE